MEFLRKKVWGWISVLLWLLCHATGNLVGAVVCSVAVAVFCIRLILKARDNDHALSGTFEDYAPVLNTLTEKNIATILIGEELRKYAHEGQPVARRTIRNRCILTPVYIFAYFLILNGTYDRAGCTFWCTLLAFAYTIFYVRSSTVRVLRRIAKKQPQRDFAQLVREELATPERSGRGKLRAVAGIALFAVAVVGFFVLHSTPRWYFEKQEGGYAVTDYQPTLLEQQTAEVPAQYQGQPVVAIGEGAFQSQKKLRAVVLPASVKSIGKQAFRDCESLCQIQLPEGLQIIDSGAFMNCKELEQIALPSTLTQLLGESFMGSGIEYIRIPEGVTEVRGDTFRDCRDLETVLLHDGILDIHAGAFYDCDDLENITLPKNITEIHAETFCGCDSLEQIRIPEGVTRIAAHAFSGCDELSGVYVPDSVREIGSSAFRGCASLYTIELPEGVIVNERAFKESPTKITYRQSGFCFKFQPVDATEESADE